MNHSSVAMPFSGARRLSKLPRVVVVPLSLLPTLIIVFNFLTMNLLYAMNREAKTSGHGEAEQPTAETKNRLMQDKSMLESKLNACLAESEISLLHSPTFILKVKQYERERRRRRRHASRYGKTFNRDEGNVFRSNSSQVTVSHALFDYMAAALRGTPYPGVENYIQYAVARLRLSPLADVEPLKPEFGAVVNDVLSFNYRITYAACRDVAAANRTLFVAIDSAPSNFEKRNLIRQTWAKRLPTHNENNGLIGIVGLAFFVGSPRNDDAMTQRRIEEESLLYGDIIQTELIDSDRNVTLKVASLFNWLYRYCAAQFDFLLKVDDDVYVNVHSLSRFVQAYRRSDQIMFGSSPGNYDVNRGKWNVSFEEWPWKEYPHYFNGAAVLMTGSTIIPLLAAFQTIPMIPFDDTYYTGLCTEKAGIELRFPSGSFSILDVELPGVCDLTLVLAWVTISQHDSHLLIEDFYRNKPQCVIGDDDVIL